MALFESYERRIAQIEVVLEKYGFKPTHAPYYIVLHFDRTRPIDVKKIPNLKEDSNTFVAKIKPLSDFLGIK